MYEKSEGQPPVSADVIVWEDACQPVRLRFTTPLVEHDWPAPFAYHWQLLTQAFGLPDPADFPALACTADERAELSRYVALCRELAECAALRHRGEFAVDAVDGQISYEPRTSDRPSFTTLARRLRQLHREDDGPGFASVEAILTRRATAAEGDVLEQWHEAREALRERPLKNIAARSVLRERRRPESEANYEGVAPDRILSKANWGQLLGLGSLPDREEHHFMVSALGLCHLYFGYALLIESALSRASATRR